MGIQLLYLLLLVALAFPVGSQSVEHVGRRAPVRRQLDQSHRLKPEDGTVKVPFERVEPHSSEDDTERVLAISPRGAIIAQHRRSPTTDGELGDGTTPRPRPVQARRHEAPPSVAVAELGDGTTPHPRHSQVGEGVLAQTGQAQETESALQRLVGLRTRPHQMWTVALLARQLTRQEPKVNKYQIADMDDPVSAQDPSVMAAESEAETAITRSTDLQHWTLGFLMSVIALVGFSSHLGSKLKVEPPEAAPHHGLRRELQPEDELIGARGRPCWTICFAASVVVLSFFTFVGTLLILKALRMDSTSQGLKPGYVVDSKGAIRKAGHPGERAFEAGLGVALSVALMGLLILRRRHAHSVQISTGLLAQFAIRGATISVMAAMVLELTGISVLSRITGLAPNALSPSPEKLIATPQLIAVALTMLMVGFAEELSKACAVILGTWLSAGALRVASPNLFKRLFRVLVESPHAFMLGGLAAGCGFMTVENVGYLFSTGLMYDAGDSVAGERFMRCMVVAVRVGLNLHPWLTGITCARIARIAFEQARDTPSLSVSELAWALWPALLVHSVFDFGLIAFSPLVAIFLPALAWFAARWAFDREWATFEPGTLEMDPSEEVAAVPTR